MEQYEIGQVIEILKIPRERFKDWGLKGFIGASIREKQGKRTHSMYTRQDIYKIGLFKRLQRSGLSRAVAGNYIGQIGDPFPAFVVVALSLPEGRFNSKVYSIDKRTGDLMLNLKTGELNGKMLLDGEAWDLIVTINTGKLRAEIDEAIHQVG